MMKWICRSEFVSACPSVVALFGGNIEAIGTAMARVEGEADRRRWVGSGNRVDYGGARARLMVARQLVTVALRTLNAATGLADAGRWLGAQVEHEMPAALLLVVPGVFCLSVTVPSDLRTELNQITFEKETT